MINENDTKHFQWERDRNLHYSLRSPNYFIAQSTKGKRNLNKCLAVSENNLLGLVISICSEIKEEIWKKAIHGVEVDSNV